MHTTQKRWNFSDITSQISRIKSECSSPYNEGFTSFELKKDLYLLKFFIDEQLKACPEFAGEKEWLQEQEKHTIIKHLKQ